MKIIRCFLLVLLTCLNVCLFGQINWQDSTVQAITYWEMYDSITYGIQLEKIQVKENDTVSYDLISYDVGVTVIDSAESYYIVEWHYCNFQYSGNNPLAEKIMGISEDIIVEILIDELGVVKGVENWEEVKEYTYAVIDKVVEEPTTLPEVNTMLLGMKQFYATEEGVINIAIQDALQFHTFFGSKYSLNERIEGLVKVPNLYYPESPFDADVKIDVVKLDSDENSYSLRYEHIVDKDQLLATTLDYLKSLGIPDEVFEAVDLSGLENTVVCDSMIDNSGWVISSRQVKKVSASGVEETEIRTISMK
ncbi:hypothetical protein [Lewinella cohaerens]|uniref:hypothetical protein n=1 Tax=Lewinella cohaerens TaxID=70995 RepID=UPI000360AB60|nr:hypothetical protein [Lewinella cohaerens]